MNQISQLQPVKRASKLSLRLILALGAVYIIWGSTYLGIQIAIKTLPLFLMAGSRFVVAGLILYIISRPKAERPTASQWRVAALVGGLLIFGGNGLVCFAQQQVPSGMAALLVGTLPLWMAILNWRFFRGPMPTWRTYVSIATGIIGLALLLSDSGLMTSMDRAWYGLALLAAPISWAIGSLRSRQGGLPKSIWLSTAMQMICGGSFLLIVGILRGEVSQVNFENFSRESIYAWLYLLIFGSLIAFSAFIWLMKNAEPDLVATYAFVNPVVAVFLGWYIANEKLSPNQLLGMTLVVAAVAMTVLKPKRKYP
ncbi:MAG: EamA family transporter [Pirellulaceae bacterium]